MPEIQKNSTNGVLIDSPKQDKRNPAIIESSDKSKHVVTVEEVEVGIALHIFLCIVIL